MVKFAGEGKIILDEVPVPIPKRGEALIKIHVSALCGSERTGYLSGNTGGMNPGHEYTGEVVDTCGTVRIKAGDRVTVNVIYGCGRCKHCSDGYPQFCSEASYLGGGHSEYVCVPESCCILLPDDVSYELGVILGGDTMGVAYRAVSKLPQNSSRIILVTGAGPVGLGMISMLKFLGHFVIVSEPGEFRRFFAKEKAGADIVLNPAKDDVASVLCNITDGTGPDAVMECTGIPGVQMKALEWVNCRGTVVFAGENPGELTLFPGRHIVHKEICLTGAFYFTENDFREILLLYRQGLAVAQLVSHSFKLSDAQQAFHSFFSGETGKVILYR